MNSRGLRAIGVLNLLAMMFSPAVHAEPITLDVKFRLTDMNYQPLPNVPVRVVFGCEPDWQKADSGQKFTTDEKGEASFTTKVSFNKVLANDAGDFLSTLMPPRPRDHLLAAAALDYIGLPALYAVDLVVHPGGTTGQEHFTVYTKDKDGNFTQATSPEGYCKLRADLPNCVFQGPGFQPFDFGLEQTESDPSHWLFKFAFKRNNPPIKISESELGPSSKTLP